MEESSPSHKTSVIHDTSFLESDPAHKLIAKFFGQHLPEIKEGIVVELGSRARSGIERKQLIPDHLDYVGFDIKEGPNVDVVGDAHELSRYFKKKSIAAVFSMSVFEHLVMPWKVAIEINKVLTVGGISFHTTHQAWPLHEKPWDFWRFSDTSWKAIFNQKTGFELIEAKMGEPGHIHPHNLHPAVEEVSKYPVYLMSTVLSRKISRSWLRWNVSMSDITDSPYPH